MAEWTLKYADTRGEIHQQVAEAASERELRDRYTQQGFLVYSVKPRSGNRWNGGNVQRVVPARRKKLNMEKFLIFNQQFVTLIRAGLPILKALDLLADRLTDPKLARYIRGVRDEVRNGALLSEAFARQGAFPPIYVTSVLAGERSGSLAEVIERFITYQKLSLSVRKKLLVSLLYPAVLVFLVTCLIVFLITFVVPNFAELYNSMQATAPGAHADPDCDRHHGAELRAAGFRPVCAGGGCVSLLVPHPFGKRSHRPVRAACSDSGRGLAEVPGGAVLSRHEHAAGGWHPAVAGARDGSGFPRYARF